jgi:hypothetical protein
MDVSKENSREKRTLVACITLSLRYYLPPLHQVIAKGLRQIISIFEIK